MTDAYAGGARRSGHEVRRFDLGALDFPVLRTNEEFEKGEVAQDIAHVQDAILWADRLVVVYPLWFGTYPALLGALFEQVLRPNFVRAEPANFASAKLLQGKSARIVVTMGSTAWRYRWHEGAYAVRALKKSLFGHVGIAPVRHTYIGGIHGLSERQRRNWLGRLRDLGAHAK